MTVEQKSEYKCVKFASTAHAKISVLLAATFCFHIFKALTLSVQAISSIIVQQLS